MLPPFFGSFVGYIAVRILFPTEITTLGKLIYDKFDLSCRDNEGSLPNCGRENKRDNPSVDVIDSLQ